MLEYHLDKLQEENENKKAFFIKLYVIQMWHIGSIFVSTLFKNFKCLYAFE